MPTGVASFALVFARNPS